MLQGQGADFVLNQCTPLPNTHFCPTYFLENLVFQGKYLRFLVEGRHHTLKEKGYWV